MKLAVSSYPHSSIGGADAEPVPFSDLHRSSGEGVKKRPKTQRDEEGEEREASDGWEEHCSGASPTGRLG